MPFATTRRRFLTLGLGGAALLGAGGALRWLTLGYSLPPGDVAVALSTKEMAIVRAIVEALLPGDDGLPSGLALSVHQRIDEEVFSQPDEVQEDLKAALQLLEHGPPLFGAFGRLTALAPEERREVLARMLRSDVDVVVQAAVAMKQLAHIFYFTREEVWPHIGYDGPWILTPRPPESSLRYAEILAESKQRGRAPA